MSGISKTFFLKVEVKADGAFSISAVSEFFDLQKYNKIQMDRAIECPINRHAVRKANTALENIPEEELTEKHKSKLVEMFFKSKGASWAQEHIRPLCMSIKEKPLTSDVVVNGDCIFLNLHNLCKKCSICAVRNIIKELQEKKEED